MKTDTIKQSNNQTFDEGPAFADLQPLFDAQSRHLDDLLRRPEARPASLNLSDASTLRARMIRAWGILALLFFAASLYWGLNLWRYQYDIYLRIFTLFLEAVFVLLTADTLSATLALLRRHPARASFDTMLRHSHRSNFNFQFSTFNFSRTATIGIAASFTLILIACTTTVGDGYTLTQDHNARLEAVAGVTSIIEQI